MGASVKTDNHNMGAKLDLRLHFLREFHATEPPHVFDACQGSGRLWSVLKAEFAIASYWGVDEKAKVGRLRVDSARVLAQPGLKADVIDVDTYGSPWRHYEAILRNLRRPTTVFLTIGSVTIGMGSAISREELAALGMGSIRPPASFTPKLLRSLAMPYCLARCHDFGVTPTSALEAPSDGNARYLGLRLLPKSG